MAMRQLSRMKIDDSQENVFWVTMADLLLGLAIIFMTLFVLAMSGFSRQSIGNKEEQAKAAAELAHKLEEANIKATVDPVTSDVKIADGNLFAVGDYNLSAEGKLFLDKLMPIYINTIFSQTELIESVETVVVQGHTDSQSFVGAKTKEEQFIRNMDLSTKRANSVAEYIFKTHYDPKHNAKLTEILAVEGKSFTEPVFTDGKEDFAKSRRVELRLKVKDINIPEALFSGVSRP